MTKKQHVVHAIVVALGILAAGLTEALAPGGALAHVPWVLPVLAAMKWGISVLSAQDGPPPGAAVVGILIGLSLLLSSCKSLGPTPPPGTPGFVNCSDAALHAAALDILPSVENALASPTYEAALALIIAQVGGPLAVAEVECAVAWVASKSEMAETATADPMEGVKAERARAWLAAHPVTFQ